jgi:hypothetical protein
VYLKKGIVGVKIRGQLLWKTGKTDEEAHLQRVLNKKIMGKFGQD